ncbi:MAG: hypothetical protein CMF55_02255 [Legionellales bacterium]|nr:hypothetical protein [Legionellales bacterium]HAG61592.1 hypothetical protein [Coxiellaceae bacterium]
MRPSSENANLMAMLACCCVFIPTYITVVIAFNQGGTALNGKDGESWLDDICNKYDIDDDAKCDLWNLLHLVFPEVCAFGAMLTVGVLACCGGVAACCGQACSQACSDTLLGRSGKQNTDTPDPSLNQVLTV